MIPIWWQPVLVGKISLIAGKLRVLPYHAKDNVLLTTGNDVKCDLDLFSL